ncbi:MAG: hypothetical protein KDD67_12255 [Ignavibacteriae bacterium]|nr:hypothetical protein [Ignavibacteriota bacterium]MCB9217213.1 hypothetical protein [Ignavibacteria bacterium]
MKRIAKLIVAVSLFATIGISGNGCKEGCDGVVCSPAPPGLIVTVEDTLAVIDTVMVYDTTAMDSIATFDTTNTIIKTNEAVVTIHTVSGDQIGDAVATLDIITTDTSYILSDISNLQSTNYTLIAQRGNRIDTTTDLTIRTVDGCCGYDVIGVYRMRLPE